MFNLVSKYSPSGDQPKAINELVAGIREGKWQHGIEEFFESENIKVDYTKKGFY